MKIAIDINDVIRAFSSKFASCYKKGIDPTYDIDNVEFTSNRLYEVFPFKDEQSYNDFVYVDYPYELFGAAEPVDKNLPARLNDWLANDLTEMDIDEIPTVILVSPYNKDSKSDYEFDKLMDLINDENNTMEKILKDGK